MAQERFKIFDQPLMAPGKCALCGLSHGDETRKFIDSGMDLDWYGVVYFCTGCFIEIANQMNYFTPEQVSQLEEDYNLVFEFNQELVTENEHLRRSVNSLTNHVCRNPDGKPSHNSEPARGKEVPPAKVVSGGTKNTEDAKHDAGKGLAATGGTKSSSSAKPEVRII